MLKNITNENLLLLQIYGILLDQNEFLLGCTIPQFERTIKYDKGWR